MSTLLDRIEKHLEYLIEININRFFFKNVPEKLAQRLSHLIKENAATEADGTLIAPDIIKILVSRERYPEWVDSHDFLENLAQSIAESSQALGYAFYSQPKLIPLVSDAVAKDQYELLAEFSEKPSLTADTSLFVLSPSDQATGHIPQNAYIVVNGRTTYNLDKVIINIGRRSTCDIILNDTQVSRDHVQLRAIKMRYILFDLDSTGGTFVNGQLCRSAVLNSGDVIRLGNSFLIYSQDMTDLLLATMKMDSPKDL